MGPPHKLDTLDSAYRTARRVKWRAERNCILAGKLILNPEDMDTITIHLPKLIENYLVPEKILLDMEEARKKVVQIQEYTKGKSKNISEKDHSQNTVESVYYEIFLLQSILILKKRTWMLV